MKQMFNDYYRGKRVLVTGHTGFKGSWLALWLTKLGADVIGIGLDPTEKLCIYNTAEVKDHITADVRVDIRNYELLQETVNRYKPEIVFHLAAQPIVSEGYKYPRYTFETNTLGTLNILEVIKNTESIKSAVLITSDKSYRNVEKMWGYREDDALGGSDPYSGSKGAAELIIQSYIDSFFKRSDKKIAVGRAGNVIGGGDFSPNRLIPDIVRALTNDDTIMTRNPNATRPWQHVLEAIHGYLVLGSNLYDPDVCFEAFNFGPFTVESNKTVEQVIKTIIKHWESGHYQVFEESIGHECGLLSLDVTKAYRLLNWKTVLDFDQTMEFVVNWYKHQAINANQKMFDFTMMQIDQYEKLI